MPTLTITRGLPGSGKTTRARAWVAEDDKHRTRVNRDDLRIQLFGGWTGVHEHEEAVTAAQHAAVSALLRRGLDVVVDDTNLRNQHARAFRTLATAAGAGFEVWDLTDVPLATCLERNMDRFDTPAFVPPEVILSMHAKHIAPLKGRPMTLPAEPADVLPSALYVAPEGAPEVVLVDIDGTLADMGKGLPGRRSPYDWARVGEDAPIEPIVRLVRDLLQVGESVVFMSGRDESCRAETEGWLSEHLTDAFPPVLHMRPAGDQRKDSIVKRELFEEHIAGRYAVRFVLDDRDQVVAMWRAMGLTVLQVADGAF
ncbi:AAA family ATPase [Dactylosporangium salmoneum]|uniref:Polynucleotide kinase PNKP phosphatase domain-containing protein n=1 Tax=Dactylosporangium salmoneum TaxID=53361 RepID=A0ABN3GA26_9ACTN